MNRLVLIADGNPTRGRSLAAACERAGVPCRTGPHGAAALELALSERPGLVVAHVDLPLVDAAKLAEILRANPRTSRSRFLFLGDAEDRMPGGPGDVLLSESSSTSDIVTAIEELVARQDRLEELDRATATGRPVEGELGPVSLADLVSLFQSSRASGRLDLIPDAPLDASSSERRAADHGVVWIRDGDVLQAETGRASNEKAFFRMLGWRTGWFRFEPRAVDEPAFMATTTRVLLQEGTRQLAEWNRLSTKLPPMDSPVRVHVRSSELPNIVHPLTHEVLMLLEMYSVVRDVVDHCTFPDYQVLRTLMTLADREIVELGQVPVPLSSLSSGDAEPLFNDAQIRRLLEWVESSGGADRSAKILVASADPEATPDFARLFRGIPGATLSDEMERGRIGPHDLAPIGYLDVCEGLRIELLHVPRSPSYQPLWGLAGHRALGTLFLLTGSVGTSAEALAPMCASLAELPRARTFHVIVLRKQERVSADELRENLSLIDEASMFLLPLESQKTPVRLMRGLFARIVP